MTKQKKQKPEQIDRASFSSQDWKYFLPYVEPKLFPVLRIFLNKKQMKGGNKWNN